MLVRLALILCSIMSVAEAGNPVATAQSFVNNFNDAYAAKHYAFEEQFWGTKMALASRDELSFSSEELSRTKKEMEDLLSDPAVLNEAKDLREKLPSDASPDLVKTLDIIIRTCQCNDMSSSPEAKSIREETSKIESDLEMARNQMELGYKDSNGDFHAMSSVGLRNLMRTSPDEATRKAAYDGLRSIGPFVCSHGFVDIVKLRNKMAKQLGFEDYYDYKVTNAEGFNKAKLFEILDGLEEGTRPLMVEGRQELERRFGKEALDPWNTSYMMAGSVVKKMVRCSGLSWCCSRRDSLLLITYHDSLLLCTRNMLCQSGSVLSILQVSRTLHSFVRSNGHHLFRRHNESRLVGSPKEVQQRLLSLAQACLAQAGWDLAAVHGQLYVLGRPNRCW